VRLDVCLLNPSSRVPVCVGIYAVILPGRRGRRSSNSAQQLLYFDPAGSWPARWLTQSSGFAWSVRRRPHLMWQQFKGRRRREHAHSLGAGPPVAAELRHVRAWRQGQVRPFLHSLALVWSPSNSLAGVCCECVRALQTSERKINTCICAF
jgi:hypothetical protein